MLRSQHDSLVMLFNLSPLLKKRRKSYTFCQASISTFPETFTCGHFVTALKGAERGYHLACAAPCAARGEMPSGGATCPCSVAPEADSVPVERACPWSLNWTFVETNHVLLAV